MGYPVRGSSPDKTTVEETIDNLSRWNMKNITLVWDRGSVSKPNIDYAREKNFHVLSGVPHTSNEVIDWITKYTDSEIEKRENILEMNTQFTRKALPCFSYRSKKLKRIKTKKHSYQNCRNSGFTYGLYMTYDIQRLY